MSKDIYESPLSSRYASSYMLHLFSPDMRFQTWRRLWVELARAEHELGLPMSTPTVWRPPPRRGSSIWALPAAM